MFAAKLKGMEKKKIKSALVSVFHKDGLDEILKKMNALGISVWSTGGTYDFITSLGIPCNRVEDLTGYPSILGGRVKTLHPKVFGGILGRRGLESDVKEMQQYEIPPFDLVVVDLYPFEKTVATSDKEAEIIEKIDIGGISLIRAAAKNFSDVVIVPSQSQYAELLEVLNNGGETDIEQRKYFAACAFDVSSHYDSAIFNYFNRTSGIPSLKISMKQGKKLRYGENPHQEGYFHGDLDAFFDILNGKELSYNNILDIDSAVRLIDDFTETTFAILKHNNACGIASRNSLTEAWKDALAGDPVSAFGGVLICNRIIDLKTAEEMNKLFFEVSVAPGYEEEALALLKSKKNRILLKRKKAPTEHRMLRTALNGVLVQKADTAVETAEQLKTATDKAPAPECIEDLIFASKLVKHTKSNAIVLAKNRQLLASGTGQTSRVDALRQAIAKAETFGFDLKGAVMASDAFFPFPDCVEIAHQAGIVAVVQPGGSVNDKASVEYCNLRGLAMVMTGVRHFRH